LNIRNIIGGIFTGTAVFFFGLDLFKLFFPKKQ
jgi:hypothetical protein